MWFYEKKGEGGGVSGCAALFRTAHISASHFCPNIMAVFNFMHAGAVWIHNPVSSKTETQNVIQAALGFLQNIFDVAN